MRTGEATASLRRIEGWGELGEIEKASEGRVADLRGKNLVKRLVKAAVGLAVLVAVGLHVRRTWNDLGSRGGLPRVDPSWAILAVALYLVGLVWYGLAFVAVMRSGPGPVRRADGLRAYFVSHLGKYVPGKALVVVMRVGLMAPGGARAATTAFASVYETLAMMAAGGFVAAIGFAAVRSGPIRLSLGRFGSFEVALGWMGLAAGVGFLVLVSPRGFSWVSARLGKRFPGVSAESLPKLSNGLLGKVLLLDVLGWLCLGFSQVAVIRSMVPGGLPGWAWPAAVGSVALATVAGFVVAVAPGGLGVREWVLWTALGAVLDQDLAVVASLGLRLAWVVGEVVAAAAFLSFSPTKAPVEVSAP